MKDTKKGSANLFLIVVIILLVGVVGYLTLIKKPVVVGNPEITSNSNTYNPVRKNEFSVTFPNAGDVLVEGQTYNITWTTPDVVPNDGTSYSLGFNWGCLPSGGGCGSVRILDIKDISFQKSYTWTVPNLKTYLGGGDSEPKISPEDKYKITLYAFAPGSIGPNDKSYSGPEFKIISK